MDATYRTRQQIRVGARFAVVRAERTVDGRTVVLKSVKVGMTDARSAELLRHEYELLQRLDLPGIARPLGLETINGAPVLVLDDAGPEDLAGRLGGRPLSIDGFLDLALRMVDIVKNLHGRGVIHRDICPTNFVLAEGPTLVDFETATAIPAFTPRAGVPGELEATLQYIAPEQTGRMKHLVDRRADLYSLGATFYEMLTGVPPFRSGDPLELVHAHVARLPHPPAVVNSRVPTLLSNIVLKLLSKMPAWRYQTAAALKADLEEASRQWRDRGTIQVFELGREDVPYGFSPRRQLYGREEESKELELAVDRAAGGGREVFLVSGPAGIGKSALVGQVRDATEGKGRWLSGKCDLLHGIVPYAPILEAFGGLIQALLHEPADVMAAVRNRVREAIAPQGRVLTETISGLEELIGEQPPVAEVGPVEAENRFQLVFSTFLRALVAAAGPILLFLDDLHWIDLASLKLLRVFAADPELRSVLTIGAYRAEELEPEHPVARTLREIQTIRPIHRIDLTALPPSCIMALLCDALRVEPEEALPLAEIVYKKTAGNPFFVHRFLAYLHRAGLLVYGTERGRWTWDAARTEAEPVTENVADLLANALRTLPAPTQQVLKTAACIGNRFDLGLLAMVCEEPLDDVAMKLWLPIQESLLVAAPEGPRFAWTAARPVELGSAVQPTYRFGHDRIQQAAYSLLGESERQELHLRIGRTLLESVPSSAFEGSICPIVDQLDRATGLIPEAERLRLTELNYSAGRQAYAASAYASALGYFRAGLELLPRRRAEEKSELWFALQSSAAECAALAGAYELCERLVDEGLEQTEAILDKATFYRVVVQANATRGAHSEAIRRGREGLRLLGLDLPRDVSGDVVRVEKERARATLGARSEQELLDAPPMEDPLERAALGLLITLSSTWFTAPALFEIISFRAADLTARRGLAPDSPPAYAYYAIALAMEGEYEEAYMFGRLAVRLAEREKDQVRETRALLCFGGHVSPWRAPIQDSIPLLRRSYALGLQSGELEFAAYAAANLLFALLIGGKELDQVLAEVNSTVTFYRKIGHLSGLPYVLPICQAARCLKGQTRARARFDDDEFEEARFLTEAAENGLGQAIFHVCHLQTSFLLADLGSAQEYARRAEQWLPYLRTLPCQVDYYFYASLVLASEVSPDEQTRTLKELRAHTRRLEVWASHSPRNFRHKHDLVAAEIAWIEDRPRDAIELYQAAIEGACRGDFPQDEAIAHERSARFHQRRANARMAAVHLRAAADGYARWGAMAKVELLEAELSLLRAPEAPPVTPSSGGETAAALDFRSLFKAAETLVSELVLDRLIEKMLRITVEAAAAQRAVLVLEEQETVVRALATATGEVMLEQTPIDASDSLPILIARRVLGTGEAVILRDALDEDPFAGDPYVVGHGVRSVLALPIRRGDRTLGVLYFENNLATDAFTVARVEVLKLLAAPIAIALENSQLFEERRRAEAALCLLADSSEVLGESLDYRAVLAKAITLVVPALADWCIVDVLEGGVLRTVASGHVDPRKVPLVEALHRERTITMDSPQPQAQALRSGKPLLISDVTDDLVRAGSQDEEHLLRVQSLEPRSIMAVPIVARERLVGAFMFVSSQSGRRYGRADLDLAAELTRRIALAIDNARLHRDLNEEIRHRNERDRYLRLIFQQLPGTVWATDRNLRMTYATGRLVEVPGHTRRDAIGITVYDYLGTHDPTNALIAHHLAALNGANQSFRYEALGRWYEVLIEPLRDERGEIAGCVGAGFDVTDRRAADEQLARSEARLAEAQRVAHIGSFEWDIEPNIVTWSEELHRIYGLTPGEFEGTYEAFLQRVHPDELEYSKSVIFKAFRDHKPFIYDHRIVRPDGSVRMLHTRGDVVQDARGKPIRMVGSCWDVTELAEATRERESLLSLLQTTIEATADGILVVDRARRVTVYNQRFLSLWRIPPEVIKRGEHKEVIAVIQDQLEDPDDFSRNVHALYADPERESIELLRLKDGRVFERYSRPQRINDTIVGRVHSFRDISDRERLLRRALFLSDAARLLASLDVDKALDGVAHLAVPYLGDGCAIDLFGDGGPRRLLALSRDQRRPISPEVHRTVLAGHSTIYRVGSISYLGVPLTVKGGLVGAMTFSAPPHRSYSQPDIELAEELAQRSALSIENARLYQRAQEALRARDEFLSIAAHEIRGPIHTLHMAIQTLRRGNVPAATLPKMFDVVERADRRLAQFVDDLLDLGRIRSGTLQFEFEQVDLTQVVRDAVTRLRPELARSGSSLSIVTEAEVVGYWDRFRLEQVASNLLSNAVKFGLGKPIQVSVHPRNGQASLVVTDHGMGIPPELRERIFNPFERGVSVRHYGGLGLGLHIVRTIVSALGGSVAVESEPNSGSTFTVELPLARHS